MFLFQFLEAACISSLVAPSSIIKPSRLASLNLSHLCFRHHISAQCDPPASLVERPCGYFGPTWIIQDNLLISRSLTKSRLQSSSCHLR